MIWEMINDDYACMVYSAAEESRMCLYKTEVQ